MKSETSPDDRHTHAEAPPATASEIARRQLLGKMSVGLGVVCGSAISVPGIGFVVAPFFRKAPHEWRAVGSVARFKVGETVNVIFVDASPLPWAGVTSKTSAWLRRVDEGNFIAFSVNCAHLGCPVRWMGDAAPLHVPVPRGRLLRRRHRRRGSAPASAHALPRPRERRIRSKSAPNRSRSADDAQATPQSRVGDARRPHRHLVARRPDDAPPGPSRRPLVVRLRQRNAVRVRHPGAERRHARVLLHCVVLAGVRDAALHHQRRALSAGCSAGSTTTAPRRWCLWWESTWGRCSSPDRTSFLAR